MADDELAKTRGRRTERTRMQRLRSPRIAPLHAFLALLALAIAILLGLAFLVVDRPGAPDERDPASAFPTAGATPSSAEAPGVDARAGPDARQRIAEPGAVTEPAARSAAASAASLVVHSLTAEGGPLSGCRLVLRAPSDGSTVADTYPMTEIAAGVHTATGLPPGRSYDVLCRCPWVPDRLAVVFWTATTDQAISVRVANREDLLGGVVVDATGTPVHGAVLRTIDTTAHEIFCITDEKGRFRFHRLPETDADTASLALTDDAGRAGTADRTPIVLSWGNLEHVLTAAERAELIVRLMDGSGNPIERFELQAESRTQHGLVARRGSAVDGMARARGLPTGVARLLLVPDGPWLPVRSEVTIAPDGSGDVSFVTRHGSVLRGVVSGEEPLEDGRITATLDPLEGLGSDAASAESGFRVGPEGPRSTLAVTREVRAGHFEFACDPHSRYRLSVHAPGYAPFVETVHAVDGKFPTVVVRLQRTHTLTARITPPEAVEWLRLYLDQDLRARAIDPFTLLRQDPPPGTKAAVLSAGPPENGLVEFTGVFPGKWLLWLRIPAGSRRLGEVTVGPNEATELPLPALEFLRPGHVRGRLTYDDRLLRPTTLVAFGELRPEIQVPVRADGTFEFHAPAANYRLRVVVDSEGKPIGLSRTLPITVSAGQTTDVTIDLVLERLTIRVLDRDSGTPIAGASLSIDEERAVGSYRVLRTDEAGTAILYPCPLGEFGLSIRDEATSAWVPVMRSSAASQDPLVVTVPR